MISDNILSNIEKELIHFMECRQYPYCKRCSLFMRDLSVSSISKDTLLTLASRSIDKVE